MRPITLQYTGSATGDTEAAQVNWRQKDFQIGWGVVLSAAGTYFVEHTFDDPADFTDKSDWTTNATWFIHESFGSPGVGKTANADGNYAFPIQGIRLRPTANTGNITMKVMQSG